MHHLVSSVLLIELRSKLKNEEVRLPNRESLITYHLPLADFLESEYRRLGTMRGTQVISILVLK